MSDSIDTPFPLDFPALNGRPVTQRHANYCAEHGHATYTNDGVVAPWCPRCGENLPSADGAGADVLDDAGEIVVTSSTGLARTYRIRFSSINELRASVGDVINALGADAVLSLRASDLSVMLGITR